MTTLTRLTATDRKAVEARGMDAAAVEEQLALLAEPPGFARLERPCTVGDGIEQIPEEREAVLVALAEQAAASGRLSRFVPASGAATRMFDAVSRVLAGPAEPTPEAARLLLDSLPRFAFWSDLEKAAAMAGIDVAHPRVGAWREVIRLLLGEPGLAYASTPKGLLLFHAYPGRSRTPFEEHLREGAAHVTAGDGTCRLFFTVSPEHLERFSRVLDALRPSLEAELGCRLEVGFSTQDPATDTIAGSLEGEPFRTAEGELLFRPGGHGALLRNLQGLAGDLVVIKNIDNILPEHLRWVSVRWKKLLTGLLVEVQQQIQRLTAALRARPDDVAVLAEAGALARRLGHTIAEPQPAVLAALLDRPLRVCGMVRNQGEPGGGPFWTRDEHGIARPQIVEGSQIDPDDPGQRAILRRATHFNPVDLVCALRDPHGRPYDLTRFVDPRAVFVSRKSHQGRPLLALERPGLWNGAMARWSTLFVEVPVATFAPVKTLFDLLRPEHQPLDG
ncbi:MAG: DUF4301 family protein [Thermoanaerobaculaceae bacterium]|nr:DUF4301 family protein [Thermoanaerobaculaceae bacterium]MDI9621365.1 DUF4301 family protein [Acidobacteriota bacterium]NLH10358.1 DUF4301 family protein [Holophagae bacterium]HPW56291.1 DUF4301 family protein [Thermoanaerobaculaceae bacterium]